MNDLIVVPKANQWRKLKALVLDNVSSPITKRVYNLGLDEFFDWYSREPRPGFTKATVSAWRVALEARGLGFVSINVRITAVRKLAVEAADNGLLAPELASGIARVNIRVQCDCQDVSLFPWRRDRPPEYQQFFDQQMTLLRRGSFALLLYAGSDNNDTSH
jgi:hypothetical protein